jgi:hypothetical protein
MERAVQFQRGGAGPDIPEAQFVLRCGRSCRRSSRWPADPSIDVPEIPATVSALVDRLVPEARRLLPGGNNFWVFTGN